MKTHIFTNYDTQITPQIIFKMGFTGVETQTIFTLTRSEQRTVKLVSPLHQNAHKLFLYHCQGGSFLTQETSGLAKLLPTSYSCICDYISALSLHCPVRGSNLGTDKCLFSSPKVQTGSGAHPASYIIVTGIISTHLHPPSKLTGSGAKTPLHLYTFVACTGKT